MSFSVPILLLVFNRPETTARVLESLRAVKPSRLFVAADGPRSGREDDEAACARVRELIASGVDWSCELSTSYRETNAGCRRAVSEGISWFFEQVEEGIVLEDDTVPSASFFPYCAELLERYRADDRIASVSGNNFLGGGRRWRYGYHFSCFNHIWGWASWRRAWRDYDVSMKRWPEARDGGWLKDLLHDDRVTSYWTELFERAYAGEVDTWDYQWTFACWINGRLSAVPAVNLVSNIGFGPGATHTVTVNELANIPARSMSFPLEHPPFVMRDLVSDRQVIRVAFEMSLPEKEEDETILGVFESSRALSESPIEKGLRNLKEGRPTVAHLTLRKAISEGARERDLYYAYGMMCIQLGLMPEGLRALERELSLYPDNDAAKHLYSVVRAQFE